VQGGRPKATGNFDISCRYLQAIVGVGAAVN